ncbi:MAG: STAS domain-containing protein [Clostridia bacterium]|nr:STAS domain-containing protein [Clostridia bacterium]
MKADYIQNAEQITVCLHGELDEYGATKIKREIDSYLDSHPARFVIFDMKDVGFVDSTGLGFLLGRYKKLRDRRTELALKNVNAQVDKVFRTSGVYSFVPKID